MKHVYTVGQVNSYIKNMFTQDFLLQSILVRGEVSNCKYHSSGHIYFTLKDEKGAIACVMFAGNRGGLKFHMREGQQVVVSGTVDVYERDGKYQLSAVKIAQDGAGRLYERFEQLKADLQEQGLFAPEYKRPIPRFIRRLGVVTAPTGAAVRDIMNIAVKEDYRRQGIATLLLNHILSLCKQKNLKAINLEVNEENFSAISLYQKFGFKECGRRKQYYDNKSDAILFTQKV